MSNLLKILVLEDLPTDAEFISRELKKAGLQFEISVVDNKTDYIQALDDYQPDVILSDHSLPQFNSIEAIEIFKKKKFMIPFILVTGSVSEEFAAKIIKLGADDYILKESLTRLPIAIQSALNLKKQELNNFIAHLELMKSEEKHRLLVSEASDAIIYMNENGELLQANHTALKLFKIKEGELLKKNFLEIFSSGIDKIEDHTISNLKFNEHTIFEDQIKDETGNLIYIEANVKKMQDGRFLAIIRNVTDRKIAALHIRESEEKYRSLIEQASDGILMTDQQGNIIEVNESFCKLMGYTSKEALQLNLLQIIPEEDIKNQPPQIDRLLKGENLIYERRLKRKDGFVFNAEVNSKMAANGMLIGFVRDITERKKQEEKIIQFNSQLEERVKERTAELEKANEELEELNDLFVGNEIKIMELKEEIKKLKNNNKD